MNSLTRARNWILSWDSFRQVYLFLCLVYFMPSSRDLEYIPLWVCFGWGSLIIAVDFFTKRKMFKQDYWYILFAMGVVYAISIMLNYQHQFERGVYNWVYLVTSFFVIYPIDPDQSKEDVVKNLTRFHKILIGTVFVASLISVIMFVFQIGYIIPSGRSMARQGFVASRLFGIYTSPNVGSIFGFLSIIGSIINNLLERKKWYAFTAIGWANVVVQYLFFLLASSRGTQLTIAVFVVLCIFFIAVPYMNQQSENKVKQFGKIMAFFVAFFFLLTGGAGTFKDGLGYVPGSIQAVQDIGKTAEVVKEESIARQEVEKVIIQHSPDDAEVSSGRFTIWAAAIDVIKQFPLFGTTDAYFYRDGIENSEQINESQLSTLDKNELKRAHGNMHNVYIQTLIMSGIVGFFVIAIFFILHLKDNITHLFSYKTYTLDYQITAIMFFLLLALFAEDFVESHIIFKVKDVVGIVFWYYLGLLQHFRKKNLFTDGVIEK